MQKIIPNVREQLLNEAKRQIAELGYGKTTIRSVAQACHLGVGTVYNYFESKDMLIATFMAEDWKACVSHIKSRQFDEPEAILRSIYDALSDFMGRYQVLFHDRDAAKVFATVFAERHPQLRGQLAELILPICQYVNHIDKAFLAEYIAESLLTWTVAGESFEKQYVIISKIIK